MNLFSIDTGLFKLDGGAMFGVVPKVLWSKKIAPDENNLCTWAARCLLIEDGKKLILIDTGLGNKQSEKFFSYYYRHGDGELIKSLRAKGYSEDDVTDVVLTHLHFDHVGGAVKTNSSGAPGELGPSFSNATYWSNLAHWKWATHPNPREKASFLKENISPLEESGVLKFIEKGESPFDHIDFIFVDGHTEQMMLPVISDAGRKFIFLADLIPSIAHLPVAWVMGYDVRPLETMREKMNVLKQAADENMVLVFEHDATTEATLVRETDNGFQAHESGPLANFL